MSKLTAHKIEQLAIEFSLDSSPSRIERRLNEALEAHTATLLQRVGEEVKFLERLKLETDVNVCECGEEWKETDIAGLIKERLSAIKQEERD